MTPTIHPTMMMMHFPGQTHASTFLHRAYRSDRLSHAYAFVGPPGIGKREAAMRFAAALFAPAEAGWDREPEPAAADPADPANPAGSDGGGDRPAAQSGGSVTRRVLGGHHPDVRIYAPDEGKRFFTTEIVDELQADLMLSPREAPLRVAILDRADAMNDAAANKFLKTLEEPPPHTQLVLLANEWLGLLETVRSRVQPVRFRPLPAAHLATHYAARYPDEAVDAATFAALEPLAQGSPGQLRLLLEEEFAAVREFLVEHILRKPPADPVDAAEGLRALVERKQDTTQEPQRQRLLLALGQTLIWWRDALVAGRLQAAEALDAAHAGLLRTRIAQAPPARLIARLDGLFALIGELLGNLNLNLWALRFCDLATQPAER